MKRKALVLCTLLMLLAAILGLSIELQAHAAGTGAQALTTQKVKITTTFQYSPATLTIKVGTTVIWKNTSSAAHTVASNNGVSFRSPVIPTGGTYSFTFKKKGTFPYHCTFHPSMKGVIIVQ
jgi:plastocyanin